jgi:hypothetical protein
MIDGFDELFDKFFGGKKNDDKKEKYDKLINQLNNFKEITGKEINEDKELGEPDSVETYTIGDVTYEKKIWEVDGGQIIKVEIKSDKANGIIEIPMTIRPSRFKQSSLEDQLDYAISVEDYEKAAQLRDEIVKRDTVVVNEPKKRGRPKKK